MHPLIDFGCYAKICLFNSIQQQDERREKTIIWNNRLPDENRYIPVTGRKRWRTDAIYVRFRFYVDDATHPVSARQRLGTATGSGKANGIWRYDSARYIGSNGGATFGANLDLWSVTLWDQRMVRYGITHSLTAALDQLRVVASSTSKDPGPRSRQHQQIGQRRYGIVGFNVPLDTLYHTL